MRFSDTEELLRERERRPPTAEEKQELHRSGEVPYPPEPRQIASFVRATLALIRL